MFCWDVHLKERPKRGLHAAAVAVGDEVFSFGGDSYDTVHIEVRVFNTVSLRWRKFPLVAPGRAQRPLDVPPMLRYHTAVLIGDLIYIWGGLTNRWEYSKVLYAFDVDAHAWFKPTVYGTIPKGRRGHSACVSRRVMYVYGGYNQLTGYTNDIYKLDTTTMVWSLINTRGTPPPASSHHSATVIGTKMFVFGGVEDDDHEDVNDNLTVFDTETDCWLNTPSTRLRPEGREGHAAFAYNGELYVFGGACDDQFFNDLWRFNPETFSWKSVEPRGKNLCDMYRMCCCMVGDRVVLFGGLYTANDLYVLDVTPSLKTLCKLAVIRYRLELSGLPHNVRWELAAMTTKI